jgi:UDP-N-acetylmuramate: L-alanyl-gamma-D-glutamyl-meso-diaminopimelate ligase
MNIHFIAIGGSAMHNLAIALHKKGYHVTGSDDEIFDPARSRLQKYGLLPEEYGWFPEKLERNIDAVILGMHARGDNPELAKARELNLKIYSYPEFLYEQSKDKLRIVIGGSHGKTSITAMILHVLKYVGIDTDYMVGAQLDGFDVMVKLSDTARYMLIEGDEYLTSALDLRPKFHVYRPDIALISGIAWDHMNVFPTFDNYVEQFRIFAGLLPDKGALVYCSEDETVVGVAKEVSGNFKKIPYSIPPFHVENGITSIETQEGDTRLMVFGKHNLMNIEGAHNVCKLLGVDDKTFYEAISTYKGANNRLELLASNYGTSVYRDFAHAPSKLKATINAVKEQFPGRKLTACFELHTYSSLNKDFLHQYHDSMKEADQPIVFFSHHALELKKLPGISAIDIEFAFNNTRLDVYTDSSKLKAMLLKTDWKNRNLLMMSSGNFEGLDLKQIAKEVAGE